MSRDGSEFPLTTQHDVETCTYTAERAEQLRAGRAPDRVKPVCDQCGQQRSIVAVRDVCAECFAHDRRLSEVQWRLYKAALDEDLGRIRTAAAQLAEMLR